MTRSIFSRLVPSFIKRRYAAKFVVSFLFVLLVISLVGYTGYAQVNSTIEDDTRDSHLSAATMQADSLDEWTQKLEYQTRYAGESARISEGDPGEVYSGISRVRNRIGATDIGSIHVIDLETNAIVSSSSRSVEEGQSLDEIGDPWARDDLGDRTADGRLWISDGSYNSSVVPGTQVIAFAAKTSNSSRAVVLTGSIEVRAGQLHQSDVNQTTNIVNVDGEYVLQPDGAADGGTSDETQLEAIRQAVETGEVQFTSHGGMIRAYAPVDGSSSASNWVAVTSMPHQDAFAVRDTVGTTVLLIVASGLVTLGFVGVVLGRQTVLPLTRLRREAERMEEGELDEADLETSRVDELGQLFNAFDSMRNSIRRHISEVEEARDEVDRTNRHLESKATEYSAVMRECADGDLTRRMDAESENEAMEEIATEFNEMIAEIEATTGELKAFATEVAAASQQVTASTEEVRAASTQVADSVQAISSGAERQNESLQAVDYEMSGLSSTVEEIASSSNEVADTAARTATAGEDGQEAAVAAIEGMNRIEAESERAVDEIEALEDEIDQIDELVEFITEIAEQTNMLALNANIEAARSAEAGGEGFGVVASEVKELAAETKEAAADIEALIEDIKSQTHRTADEVQQTSRQVAEHREAIEHAATSLEQVATYAKETNDGVQDISAATEQQAASTQEVVAMVDEAASISEETASEAENVAAAAEEQTSSLTEVSRSVVDLAEQAARLSEELAQFETDADVESARSVADRADADGADGALEALPEVDDAPVEIVDAEATHEDDGRSAVDFDESRAVEDEDVGERRTDGERDDADEELFSFVEPTDMADESDDERDETVDDSSRER